MFSPPGWLCLRSQSGAGGPGQLLSAVSDGSPDSKGVSLTSGRGPPEGAAQVRAGLLLHLSKTVPHRSAQQFNFQLIPDAGKLTTR